jgi:F0F1-type ATP synthase delta subunit
MSALKTFLLSMEKIHGRLSGKTSSVRLETMLRFCMKETGHSGKGTEFACRLLVLLVRKRMYTRRNALALMEEMDRVMDHRHGFHTIKVEAPFPLEKKKKNELMDTLKTYLGLKEIKLVYRYVPELIGGYRIRLGDLSIDASVRFLLKEMCTHLDGTGGFVW